MVEGYFVNSTVKDEKTLKDLDIKLVAENTLLLNKIVNNEQLA